LTGCRDDRHMQAATIPILLTRGELSFEQSPRERERERERERDCINRALRPSNIGIVTLLSTRSKVSMAHVLRHAVRPTACISRKKRNCPRTPLSPRPRPRPPGRSTLSKGSIGPYPCTSRTSRACPCRYHIQRSTRLSLAALLLPASTMIQIARMDLMLKSRDRNAVPLTQNSPRGRRKNEGERKRGKSRPPLSLSLSPFHSLRHMDFLSASLLPLPAPSPRPSSGSATCFSADGISGRNE